MVKKWQKLGRERGRGGEYVGKGSYSDWKGRKFGAREEKLRAAWR